MTAGDDIRNKGTVNGSTSESATSAKVVVPTVSVSAGGEDLEVPKNGFLLIQPNSYGDVEVKKRGTLSLTSCITACFELSRLNFGQPISAIFIENSCFQQGDLIISDRLLKSSLFFICLLFLFIYLLPFRAKYVYIVMSMEVKWKPLQLLYMRKRSITR